MNSLPNNAAEEIFRFSVVRNPSIMSSRKMQDSVVNIISPIGNENYFYTNALANLRRDSSRDRIIEEANLMINAPEFIDHLDSLQRPMWKYVEAIQLLPKLTHSSAGDLIEKVFEMKAEVLVTDSKFLSDRTIISDSLVLASVVAPLVPGLRTRLMWARRAIAFIERTANPDFPDKTGSEKLLFATLLLPPSVFPLPDANHVREEKNKKNYDHKKKLLEEKNAQAQLILDKLTRNVNAIDELSSNFSSHLIEQDSRNSKNTKQKSLLILPIEKVKRLGQETRIAIRDLSLSESDINVPFVISEIERQNFALRQDLATNFGDLLVEASPTCLNCQNVGECRITLPPPPNSPNDFTPDTRGAVEIVGIQDLLIVRQSFHEYRAGEISHIENVLQGEKKNTTNRKLDRIEVTTVEEVEKEQVVENDLQTTDKYELQSEVSQVIQDDSHLDARVTVTASYGTVNVESHGNYASNSSNQETKNSASTYARDVVSRTLQRIKERVLSRRTRTQISEIEVTNLHELNNNQQGAENISGIYRWVDKFYVAQIVNYGKRLMLEFMIPEPAAFYKYATAKRPLPFNIEKPDKPGFCCNGTFIPLSPDHLRPDNYLCFVSKYNAKDVAMPPTRFLWTSDSFGQTFEPTQENPMVFSKSNDKQNFKLPDGYFPRLVKYNISGTNAHSGFTSGSDHDDNILVLVTIENKKVFRYFKNEYGKVGQTDVWPDIGQVQEWGNELTKEESDLGAYWEGPVVGEHVLQSIDPVTGVADTVEVSLTGQSTLPISVNIHYSVLCEITPAKYKKWQMDTFNAIMTAYEILKQDFDDAMQGQQLNSVESIQGGNPLYNRDVERKELKKYSISLLTGQQYESFNAMEYDYQTGIPQVDLSDAAEEGKYVRFFEQALEWINMTYIFYPYFWGRKEYWAETVTLQNADPLFEQFLKAGYSRVWVPVRPGFEPSIMNFIECGGEPWNERDAPLPGHTYDALTPTVAIIDEIKEQLGVNFEFRQGTIEVKKNKRTVVGKGTDFRPDDKDREILIDLIYYRIAEVDEVQQRIILREPYSGEDQEGIGFAIGVKFVGEPWLVQVPTTLVKLSSRKDLILE